MWVHNNLSGRPGHRAAHVQASLNPNCAPFSNGWLHDWIQLQLAMAVMRVGLAKCFGDTESSYPRVLPPHPGFCRLGGARSDMVMVDGQIICVLFVRHPITQVSTWTEVAMRRARLLFLSSRWPPDSGRVNTCW